MCVRLVFPGRRRGPELPSPIETPPPSLRPPGDPSRPCVSLPATVPAGARSSEDVTDLGRFPPEGRSAASSPKLMPPTRADAAGACWRRWRGCMPPLARLSMPPAVLPPRAPAHESMSVAHEVRKMSLISDDFRRRGRGAASSPKLIPPRGLTPLALVDAAGAALAPLARLSMSPALMLPPRAQRMRRERAHEVRKMSRSLGRIPPERPKRGILSEVDTSEEVSAAPAQPRHARGFPPFLRAFVCTRTAAGTIDGCLSSPSSPPGAGSSIDMISAMRGSPLARCARRCTPGAHD